MIRITDRFAGIDMESELSLVSHQLAAPPMMLFASWIERARGAAVQRVRRGLSQSGDPAFVITSADLVSKRSRVRRAGARSAEKECYSPESELQR